MKLRFKYFLNSFSIAGLQRVSNDPHIFRILFLGDRRFPFLYLVPLSVYYLFKHVTFISTFYWHVDEKTAKKVKKTERRYLMVFPKHNFKYLANSNEELENLKKYNLDAILCNHNCFVDENIYKPLSLKKKFNAVYDARITPFKRYELASRIKNLGIISYNHKNSHKDKYMNRILLLLGNVHRFNLGKDGRYHYLNDEEVNNCLNQCKVGIILSEVEGANYASIQYLLAGLPVVSTKSKGGRDVFFDTYNSIIAKDEPEDIAMAVKKLIELNPDPMQIRNSAIAIQQCHREIFYDLINQIYQERGKEKDFRDEWSSLFFNKFIQWVPFWKVL